MLSRHPIHSQKYFYNESKLLASVGWILSFKVQIRFRKIHGCLAILQFLASFLTVFGYISDRVLPSLLSYVRVWWHYGHTCISEGIWGTLHWKLSLLLKDGMCLVLLNSPHFVTLSSVEVLGIGSLTRELTAMSQLGIWNWDTSLEVCVHENGCSYLVTNFPKIVETGLSSDSV